MKRALPFLDKVEFVPMSGCWIWTGALTDKGYGTVRPGKSRKMKKAHRASWELHKGPIPKGMAVLHKCDVRCCVNPDHLYLGTQQDNMDDMMSRGRHVVKPKTKLNASDVVAIRALRGEGRTLIDLARAYNVTEANICAIVNRKTWQHI